MGCGRKRLALSSGDASRELAGFRPAVTGAKDFGERMKECANTQYGFNWGNLEVIRICSDKKCRVLGLRTPITGKGTVDIYISPTGRIRVFNHKGKELKA